jgi:UTP-glucose-1-phosphate uridylyltransferase
MIIGGDTLFSNEFDLSHEVALFSNKTKPCPTLLFYELEASVNASEKGIVDVEQDGDEYRIVRFIEKPKPHETSSRLACPCFYLLNSANVPLINTFLKETKDANMRDAPGHFVKYLCENVECVHARKIERRFDVGHLADYEEADKYFQ